VTARIVNKAQLKVVIIRDDSEIVEVVPFHKDKDSLLKRQPMYLR